MRREYWWALITLIIAVALAVFLLSVAAEDSSDSAEPLASTEYNRRLDRLDRKGVEAAYVTRVGLLFQNWMTDTNQASQERALKGHRNARDIYVKVMRGIDARDAEGGFELQTDTSTPVILPSR
jgi:hypothetical protein